MATPRKTLFIEQISYAEEALQNLTTQLHDLFKHVEFEHKRMFEELKTLKISEAEIEEEIFERINEILNDAWTNAMSAQNRLQQIDEDLSDCDSTMMNILTKLKSKRP